MDELFDLNELDDEDWVPVEPPQIPVTILDIERTQRCFDMHLPMADPCPTCGGVNMQVGDWVCYGQCSKCEEKDYLAYELWHL